MCGGLVCTLPGAPGVSLCPMVTFGKWKDQPEIAGQVRALEMEVITPSHLLAWSHVVLAPQDSPFPKPWRPFPPSPVRAPAPIPDTPALGFSYTCSHFATEPLYGKPPHIISSERAGCILPGPCKNEAAQKTSLHPTPSVLRSLGFPPLKQPTFPGSFVSIHPSRNTITWFLFAGLFWIVNYL